MIENHCCRFDQDFLQLLFGMLKVLKVIVLKGDRVPLALLVFLEAETASEILFCIQELGKMLGLDCSDSSSNEIGFTQASSEI